MRPCWWLAQANGTSHAETQPREDAKAETRVIDLYDLKSAIRFFCAFAALREIRCIFFWLRVSDPRSAAWRETLLATGSCKRIAHAKAQRRKQERTQMEEPMQSTCIIWNVVIKVLLFLRLYGASAALASSTPNKNHQP